MVTSLTENTPNCISTVITKTTSSNVDTCVVEVPLGFTIGIGDEFELNDVSSTLLFTGIVQSIKTSGNKEVTIYDYGVQLQNRIVNDIYNSKTPEYIIEDIVSNYTDMTYVSTIVSSASITSYVIKDKTAWDVIVDLIEVLNASFRVDKNKNFYLELIEEDVSTETITTTNAVIDEDWDEVSDSLVNKITLIGDKQLFEKTEKFNGTGAQTTFALAEFPVDVNVTVGGTEQTGYVEGASTTADYSVDKSTKSIVFESGSIPTTGTNNVVIRYTFSIDIKLQSQDNDSISLYGIKEKKITKTYITSFQEGRRYSNFYLGIYAKPLLTSTWNINAYSTFESFVPNQIIPVDDSIRSVTGNYIIKKVEREFPGKLKVSVGWKEDDILDWAKETQYRVKQLEETDDNSTVLQLYDFIENNITINVNSTMNRQLYRDLPTNYMYWGDSNDTPVYANIGDGTARPLRTTGATELFFLSDKDYWGTPDYEITQTGFLQSWLEIGIGDLLLETGDNILLENGFKIKL